MIHVATVAVGNTVLVVRQDGRSMFVTGFDNGETQVWDSPLPDGAEPEQTLAWALDLAMGLGAHGPVVLLHEGAVPADMLPPVCLGADAVFNAKTGAALQ